MKNRGYTEVKEFVESVFYDATNVKLDVNDNFVEITCSAMYDAPTLNFGKLMLLSDFFETKNINDDDHYGTNGCETCDYGSDYGWTIQVRPD